MWARSHTSGLMIGLVTRSRSSSPNGATIASVRSRASARTSTIVSGLIRPSLAHPPDCYAPDRWNPSKAGAAPHLHDLAHGGGPVGDAGVQRAHRELETPRLPLVELGDERMEAPSALVHEHDVAGTDALGRRA